MKKTAALFFVLALLVGGSQAGWAGTVDLTETFNFVDSSHPHGWHLADNYQAIINFDFTAPGNTAIYQRYQSSGWPYYTHSWVTKDTETANPDVGSVPAGAVLQSANLIINLYDDDYYSEVLTITGLNPDTALNKSYNLNFYGNLNPPISVDVTPYFNDFKLSINVTDCGSGHDLFLKNITLDDMVSVPTPEPSSIILLGSGLLGLGVFARRRFRR